MKVNSILAVCTGNICRSPYVEGLLQQALPDVRVESAGIGAVVGGQMPEAAAVIADREGLDLAHHRGRQVSGPILREHELVLVMESAQKNWLAEQYPHSRGRVFMISHWQNSDDVPDPYRHDEAFFREVFAQLADYVGDWIERLSAGPKASGPAW